MLRVANDALVTCVLQWRCSASPSRRRATCTRCGCLAMPCARPRATCKVSNTSHGSRKWSEKRVKDEGDDDADNNNNNNNDDNNYNNTNNTTTATTIIIRMITCIC